MAARRRPRGTGADPKEKMADSQRSDEPLTACDLRAEEVLDRFFTLSIDMLCIAGFDGYFKRLNPAWERVLGYTVAELTAKPFLDFIHPEDRAATVAEVRKLGTGATTVSFENRYRARDGSYKWLLWNATPLTSDQLIYASGRDITERKQAEHDIQILKEAAESANRAKTEFLARMSHEIRTPLNVVIGVGDLLSRTPLTAEQQQYVGVFQRAGSNLLTLINDILDLSKVESGRILLESVDFDLAEAVDGAIEIASLRAKEKEIAIVTEITPDVPQKLSGDPDRLRQVLINLLANAVKFTPKGTVRVRIGRDSANGEPGALRFAISDEGIGIPPAKLEEIFEAFAQADASTTRKYGGTGLGLAISKRLVELMGGHIWAESRPGAAGSTFYFTARFGAAEGISMRAGAAFEMPRGGNATPHSIAPALRILVVDDSEDNRYLMAEYLKDLGAQVDFADNGETALEKFRSCEYDVVLMDLQMPVMDGWEATSQVRQWEKEHRTRVVPVIVLTASALDTEAQRALDAGCTAFLRKPVRLVTLLDAIRKYTVRDTASGESPSPNRITIVADARIRPLIPGYLENRRKDVDAVLAALERNDYSTIRALGHKMSGTGGGYGFQRITDIGSELEKAAKQQNGADVRRQASELQTFLEQLDVLYP